jgi:dTDP-3,4-didehydro-2,6-dideoxy-alpha-D-glucose 3-reductase
MKKINFGIIGCSSIAERSVLPAMKISKLCSIAHIGSRQIKKAKQFATKFKCKNFGTYEDILDDKNIDAVYISLPIGLHSTWVKKALKSGKHILCEKSIVTNFNDAKTIVSEANKKSLQLLEGFSFRFHPQHAKVQNLLTTKLGMPFSFTSNFGFPLDLNSKTFRLEKKLGGGVLNDVGCYPICASRIIFGELPIKIESSLTNNSSLDVDVLGTCKMIFSNNRHSYIAFGYKLQFQSTYDVWGSNGFLRVLRAYNMRKTSKAKISLDTIKSSSSVTITPTDQFLLMIDSFCNSVFSKTVLFDFKNDILDQAKLMDAVRISSKKNCPVYLSELR